MQSPTSAPREGACAAVSSQPPAPAPDLLSASLPPDLEAARRTANRRGILAMMAAMASFVANDALVKYASETLPMTQLIFVRGVMSSLLVLAVAHAMGATARIREIVRGRIAVRAGFDALATMFYLSSLAHLPLGNATAINLAAPLLMIVFAVLFLHERVGLRRWFAIFAGFAGVLLVIQPRAEGFNAWAWVCLAGTLFHATRDLLTRYIPQTVPAILITLATAVSVTLVAGLATLTQGWQAVTLREAALLGAAAVLLSMGYYFIIHALRQGEMSLIAPFRYSGLLYALVLGYAVWGDVPNAIAWCGIALLVGSGLYVLHGERSRQRSAALDAAE